MITGREDLMRAMAEAFLMEKGTVEFYTAAASGASDGRLVKALEELAGWERKHMQYIEYLYVSLRDEKETRSFDYFLENVTPGEVEGGVPVEYAAEKLEERSFKGDRAIISAAMEIEVRAYDLYKHLSESADDPNVRVFTGELAGWEKKHIAYLRATEERIFPGGGAGAGGA